MYAGKTVKKSSNRSEENFYTRRVCRRFENSLCTRPPAVASRKDDAVSVRRVSYVNFRARRGGRSRLRRIIFRRNIASEGRRTIIRSSTQNKLVRFIIGIHSRGRFCLFLRSTTNSGDVKKVAYKRTFAAFHDKNGSLSPTIFAAIPERIFESPTTISWLYL